MKYQNNAAVWKKKTKNGATYLAFKAERDIKEGEWLSLFSNKRKTSEKHPDFTSYNKIEDNSSYSKEVNPDDIPL